MNIQRKPFGITKTGKNIDSIIIENSHGASIELITYGARLISCRMPDQNGNIDELLYSSRNIDDFEGKLLYHGATIGRYANRIANAQFTLDGTTWELQKNEAENQLHGGPGGFHSLTWDAFPIRYEDRGSVKFSLTSKDGDQGFPGNLDTAVTVSLTEKNELIFLYEAVSDAPTYISLTNHAYWNLEGAGKDTIHGHILKLSSEKIVEPDNNLIPTGNFLKVENTAFDFLSEKQLGDDIDTLVNSKGYDHNFVLQDKHTPAMKKAAVMKAPHSGRTMTLETNAPGLQLYTDNYSSPPYQAFCLEAGELPDAMNHELFPSPRLMPGEMYRQITVYGFSVK